MKLRPRVLTAVVAMTLFVVAAGCSRSPSATDWFFGNALVIRVKQVRLVEEVRYTGQVGTADEGKHFVIRPSEKGRMLAAANLEVRNREAQVIYLSVAKEAVQLRDDQFLDYQAIDPFQGREEVSGEGAGENSLLPFIWGDVEMPSKCGEQNQSCQLVGWVLFDVPRNIKFYQLIWDTADTIYLRF